MKKNLKRIFLMVFGLYCLYLALCAILSPIMAHIHQYDLSAKLTALFMFNCHQRPERTFWIFGYPMALCARCFGTYLGCAVSCFLELFNKLNINKNVIIALIIFSFGDVLINFIIKGFNSGNFVRFFAGICLGIVIVKIISYLFNLKGKNNEVKEKHC